MMFFYTQSKLFPWHAAQVRITMMQPVVAVGAFWSTYWNTWAEVFRPTGGGVVLPFRRGGHNVAVEQGRE